MNCSYCGHEIKQNIIVCPNCGKLNKFTKELIEKAIAGNQDSITELYNATYNKIYRTVRAMIKDEDTVLDIVQDSYIKGFQSLSQLESPESYQAWMKRIAINKTKDFLKRNKPVLFTDLSYDDEEIEFEDVRTENLPEKLIDQKETTRLINEILNSLSEEQRVVIGMFYYEQMSVKDIAEVLECSENTVKSRLNYGRKKIEVQVRELEKKGTKLYSLAPIPFLLWLFKCTDTQAVEIPAAVILESIKLKLASGSATAVAEVAATDVVAKNVIGGGIKTTIGSFTKAVTGKVIVGFVAAAITMGGAVAASMIIKNHDNYEEINSTEKLRGEWIEDVTENASTSLPTSTPESTPMPTETPKPTPTAGVTEINLADYISVSYEGYSGDVVASFSLLKNELYSYVKELWSDDEESEKIGKLNEFADGITFESDSASGLSNGDSFTVNIIFDESLAAELGISFTNISRTYLVDGVKEKTIIDPFSSDIFEYRYRNSYQMPNEEPVPINGVYITYNGISPGISMSIKNCYYDETNPLSMIAYTLDKSENLKNGDSVNITASFIDGVDSSAYKLKSTNMRIDIEGRISYVDDISQLNAESLSYLQNELGYYFDSFVISEYPLLKCNDDSWYDTSEIIPAFNDVYPYGVMSFSDSESKVLSEGVLIYPFTMAVNDVVLNPVVDYDLNYRLDLAPVESFPALYGYFTIKNLMVDSDGDICYENYLQFELGDMYKNKQYMNQVISGIN